MGFELPEVKIIIDSIIPSYYQYLQWK